MPAEDMLADAKWRTVSWRSGTKGRLKSRFAAVRVRIADGPPQRIWDKGQQHLPGDEAWLIGEHRPSGEKKYYLANLPTGMDLGALAATIKARWVCEQAHQQSKEELSLAHFEARSWAGLHRHALMTMIACALLQHRRLTSARRKKRNQRTAASTKPAGRATRHHLALHPIAATAMPSLPNMDGNTASAKINLPKPRLAHVLAGWRQSSAPDYRHSSRILIADCEARRAFRNARCPKLVVTLTVGHRHVGTAAGHEPDHLVGLGSGARNDRRRRSLALLKRPSTEEFIVPESDHEV